MKLISRGSRGGMALALVFLTGVAAPLLAAQDPEPLVLDTSGTTVQSLAGNLLDNLPGDRIDALLPLRPGITATGFGQPSLRGGNAGDAAAYVDGVPVLPGFRGAPLFRSGAFEALDARITPGTNAIEAVDVITGPLPAGLGNGRAGAILYRTRRATGPPSGSIAYESDEGLGGARSLGFNRVQGAFGGAISSRFSLMAVGVLEGQRGMNTGFEADHAPVFAAAGVDTTLLVPQSFDPGAPSTLVPVYNYAVYRGSCDQFARSANAEIAANFGRDCSGSRLPTSTVSNYQFLGRATYALGEEASVSLLALASQSQNRNFDYGNLDNTQALTGNRGASAVYALSLRQPLRRSVDAPILLQVHLSHQRDRELSGPLTPGSAADLDPSFGGFALAPLDLRFDFKSFPVNDELVRNYQLFLAGSRRTPLDPENAPQYSLIDQFRNNAYGLYNFGNVVFHRFFDSGGPAGSLTLYRENRWVGAGALDWTISQSNRFRVGGEFTRLNVANYFSGLYDMFESDVYLENPIRAAVFAEDHMKFGPATLTAGLRFEYYKTGARRSSFPVIISHPSFNAAEPDAFLENDTFRPSDEAHSNLSPRFQLALPASHSTVLRAGYAQQVQMPDLRLVFAGINSDINLTGFGMAFGSDLDFEKTRIYELGIRHQFDQRTSLDVAGYLKQNRDEVAVRLVSALDPTSGTNAQFRSFQNAGESQVRGMDVRFDRQFSEVFSVSLAYSYQDATESATGLAAETDIPTSESRPHAVAGILSLGFPADWRRGSLAGAILERAGLFAAFRAASGAPYTRCMNVSVLTNENCAIVSELPNAQRLPSYKQLDLRFTKGIGLGGRTLTAYVDVRNLLNTRNVLAVFASSGATSSPQEAANHRAFMLDEYGVEALQSGVRLPDGSIDLRFGGIADPRAGCGTWQDVSGVPAAPNCVYLIRAEERFGNGDHLFDVAEQTEAADALYQVLRGIQNFTGAPRRVRLGLELEF